MKTKLDRRLHAVGEQIRNTALIRGSGASNEDGSTAESDIAARVASPDNILSTPIR